MLQCEALVCRRGDFVLGPLDLVPGPGITGVCGPNGCGKSTLCALAAGILRPASGRILTGGRELAELSGPERAGRVALVAQELPRAEGYSVIDFVSMGYYRFSRRFYCDGREAALAALGTVDLDGYAAREFSSLSGGEKRRAALARALVQDAAVLLLDEPGSHLDYGHNRRMAGILRGLADRTILLVSHDLDFLAAVCREVVAMQAGKIVRTGPADVVLRDTRFLAGLFNTAFTVAGGRILPELSS